MIKAGSGTMKPRDDRPSFVQSGRLNLPALLRWLLMVCVLAAPGYAVAKRNPQGEGMCTHQGGSQAPVNVSLPPAVTFSPGESYAPGTVLYTSPEVSFAYECSDDADHYAPANVFISRLRDFSPLVQALSGAGIKIVFQIRNDDGPFRDVDMDNSSGAASFIKLVSDYRDTITGTLTARLELRLITNKIKPGFYLVPSLTSFKVSPYQGSRLDLGFSIITGATRLQYVPKCFVKASVDPVVNFGTVLTSDINSSFSMPRSFNVGAGVNNAADCNIGNLTDGYGAWTSDGQKSKSYIKLPLKVEFLVAGGGAISSDNKAILLKNDSGENNGLQLKISDPDGNVVTFGDVAQPGSNPASRLGEFNDGIFTVNKKYTATLSPTGKPVKIGKYSAKVTVKVSYY